MADESYHMTSTLEGDVLRVVATGPASLKLMKRLLDQVADEIKARGSKKVLVDLHELTGRLSNLERYQIGEYAVGRIRVKIAVIAPAGLVNHLGETVAVNRGVNVRVFTEEIPAVVWLRAP